MIESHLLGRDLIKNWGSRHLLRLRVPLCLHNLETEKGQGALVELGGVIGFIPLVPAGDCLGAVGQAGEGQEGQ